MCVTVRTESLPEGIPLGMRMPAPSNTQPGVRKEKNCCPDASSGSRDWKATEAPTRLGGPRCLAGPSGATHGSASGSHRALDLTTLTRASPVSLLATKLLALSLDHSDDL